MSAQRFTCTDALSWSVETGSILLFARGRCFRLDYPKAAIWDILARGQSMDTAMSKTALIARLGRDETAALVADCILEWRREGWLHAGEDDG
jgi:hypothetical protein